MGEGCGNAGSIVSIDSARLGRRGERDLVITRPLTENSLSDCTDVTHRGFAKQKPGFCQAR